jgi:hypothetical protein
MTAPIKKKSWWWMWMAAGATGYFVLTHQQIFISNTGLLWGFLNKNYSGIIAVCALVVTFWQGCVIRKHNKLSVRPMIATMERHDEKDGVGYIGFDLENSGVGPAVIKSFVLLHEDSEVSRNNRKTYDDFLRDKTKGFHNVYTGSLVPGYSMQAGTKHPLLIFSYETDKHDVSFIHDLNIIVEYQSIYQDEVFTYDSRKDRQFHGREVQDA